jgi:hypothetical protein
LLSCHVEGRLGNSGPPPTPGELEAHGTRLFLLSLPEIPLYYDWKQRLFNARWL